ncbi:hypothetical protein [Cupriavidus sp. UBA2534]|nr:hypothetical protein [Cupriavidus sp. UBA2534]
MKLLRAIAFWFAVAFGVIALSGLYAWANDDAAATTPTTWSKS